MEVHSKHFVVASHIFAKRDVQNGCYLLSQDMLQLQYICYELGEVNHIEIMNKQRLETMNEG